jgi:hypothetical protein
MFREALCCLLILTLVGSGGPAIAKDMTGQQVKDVVEGMANRSCKVTMKDGSSLQGKITKSSSENFTIAGEAGFQTVSYADVAEIKKKGMPLAAKVVIGLLVAVLGAALGAYALECHSSRGCPN